MIMSKKFLFLICTLFVGGMQAIAQDFENATDAVKNMGLGWNLGNTFDSTNWDGKDGWNWASIEDHEQGWGQPITKPELLKMMKDAGFGAIRVPVTWFQEMDSNGKVKEVFMNRVKEVVDYVISQGLYCILNVHHDTGAHDVSWLVADETIYNNTKDRYENLWKQIAEKFKDYDQRLLFEGYNEMLDNLNSWCFASFNATDRYDASVATSAYNAINGYAQSFVNAVRATGGNNAKRNLIVNTYGCCSGGGTWNSHLKDPLKEMKLPTDAAGEGHMIFQVHAYPSIVNTDSNNKITGNRTIASIQSEIDDMINAWKEHLVSKGAPVILGEWGTSNVDGEVTDYEARRDLMFQFCEYFVKQCKANDIATFYWMGITDGMARFFPAFSQPDLAKTILQAYHGTDFNPVLPDASRYSISCTVDFTKQWGELYLYNSSSFTSADYSSIVLELEEAPASGSVQFKVYCSKYSNGYSKDITTAESTLPFAATMGTIKSITLQCKQNSARVKVKSVKLKKKNGEELLCNPSVAWNCTMSDITVTTGINSMKLDVPSDSKIYDLMGRQISIPTKGIYISNGKKYIAK